MQIRKHIICGPRWILSGIYLLLLSLAIAQPGRPLVEKILGGLDSFILFLSVLCFVMFLVWPVFNQDNQEKDDDGKELRP